MARHALIRPDNSIDRMATNIDPKVQTKPGFRWLPCPEQQSPAFDPETEIIEGPSYAVGASSVTESWSKRAKTAAELDAAKDARVSSIDKVQLKILFNQENRIRALAGQSAVNQAQFLAAIKALL